MSYKREIILNTFRELIFNKTGKALDSIQDLKADASERKIYRLFSNGNSFIGIYNENQKENLAFINFTNSFVKLGFNVPIILNVSDDNLFYVEQDLGDTTLYKLISGSKNGNMHNYYQQALSDLIRFQVEVKDNIDFNYCYQTKLFNSEVIEKDLNKFFDCYLNNFLKEEPGGKIINEVIEYSEKILVSVRNDYFLYRDFQPRNIMIKEDQFYYIDYQSGRRGPLQYDVASFLYSGSIKINEDERKLLLKYYVEELNKYVNYSEDEFMNYFYFFAFLRLLQMLGSYAELYLKRNDEDVLKKISKAIINLNSLKNKISNSEVNNFIDALISSSKSDSLETVIGTTE